MKPVLYNQNETQFRTFGLGEIADAYAVEVTRERNGNYTLYLKYPLDGAYAARFKNGMKIKADAGVRTKWQTFEISRVKRNSKEYIEVFAKHISHRTEYLQLKPKVKAGSQTAQMALSLWKENLIGDVSFDVWSDIDTVANVNWEIGNIVNSRDALGGVNGSILDLFGGEYEFDNTLIRLHKRLGRQAPVVLEYGRNVVSIEQDDNFDEVYTTIYPFAKYTPQSEGEGQADEVLVTLPELIVDGPYLANFDKRRIKLVDFSGHFQNQEVPTINKIRSLAKSYVVNNRIGLPKVDIEVDYVDLANTLDYKDFAIMEEVELCDVIPLYYPNFGITSTEEKVVEIVYNVLKDENKTIKLGVIGKTITQSLTGSVMNRVEQLENKQATQEQVLSSYLVDGKGNRVWRERPSADIEHKVGDVWFEKNGIYERMYIWNGNQWEKILDTEDADRVAKEIDSKIQEVNENMQANEIAHQQQIDELFVKADTSKSLAEEAKSISDQAKLDAANALTSAETTIKIFASQIETKLSRADADKIVTNAITQSERGTIQRISEVEEGLSTKVQEVRDDVLSHTRTIFEQGKSISQVIQTAQGLVSRVSVLTDNQNLVYDPTNFSKYKKRNTGTSNLVLTGTTEYKLLRITESGLTSPAWRGFQMPLHSAKFRAGEKLSYRVNLWVDALPDDNIRFEIKNGDTMLGGFDITATRTGASQIFTGTFTITSGAIATDDYGLHVFLRKNGRVAIGQISIVRGDNPPATFVDSTSDMQLATETQVSQLAGSWAVQNLTSAGTILNQINLNKDGSIKIDGSLLSITAKTYIANGVIKSAMIESLDAGKVNVGTLNGNTVNIININASNIVTGKLSANFISGGLLESLNGNTSFNLQTGWIDMNAHGVGIRNQFSDRPLQYLVFGSGSINNISGSYTAILSNRNGSVKMDSTSAGIQIWNAKSGTNIKTAVNIYGKLTEFMASGQDGLKSIKIDTSNMRITGLNDLWINDRSLYTILDNIFHNFRALNNNGNYSRDYYANWR